MDQSSISFGEEEIDLDVTKEVTMDFIRKTIEHLASNGCDLIRLDAFAYAEEEITAPMISSWSQTFGICW